MNIEEFLSRLEGVQGGADATRWTARCPAHDDGQNSLGIHVTPQGKILLKCYAGCPTTDIVAAMGLKMSDLFADDRKAMGKQRKASGKKATTEKKSAVADASAPEVKPLSAYRKKRPSKHVCYYEYQDETGAVTFRVDRRVYTDEKGGKTFWQQHPNERGGWDFGVSDAGVQRVPFRLPKILAAAKEGKNVLIVEGEKDVINVEKCLGVVATCNPGGAGKWEKGWGRFFKGVPKILIIADNDALTKIDEKTGEVKVHAVGQRHANMVERLLREDGFEGEIRKMVLPEVDGEKCKDFSDWVAARVRRDLEVGKSAFQEVIKSAAAWPSDWTWSDDADLIDLQRAQNSARNSAFSNAPEMPGDDGDKGKQEKDSEKRKDGRGQMGEAGRFGRICPRAPLKDREWYQVDFQMDPARIARLNVCRDAIQFEGWQRSERAEDYGDFIQMASYDPIKCPASRMVSMAVGCMDSFNRNFKLQNPQRTELSCMLALAWLRSRGKFFADIDNPMYATSLYFDSVDGVLYNIQSNEFQSFLATEVNISRENKVFKFMMALIEDMTMMKDVTPRVRPSKEWDRVGDAIYVSNGDSRMYKVTANKVEDVANGTDGVVFLRGATLMPFKLREGSGLDPFVHSMLFRYASLEKDTDVMNCRLWFLNLFMCDQNKPILLVNGPRGSGKTFLLQGMKQFLGIRTNGQLDDSYNKMEKSDKGAENFWIIIDKGRFEIFDNFDTRISWADNDFQVASTGGTHKTRELYKTDVLVTLYARAFFALTSNNAVFTSEGGGLPDRIIKIGTIGRPKVSKGPAELKADNMAHREEYMTFVLRTLAAALADKGKVDENINRRHPEFADFAVRCGRAMGCEAEAIRALSTAEIEKSVLPLMNDMIAKEIVTVLLNQEKVGDLGFTAGEMTDMIIGGLDTDEVDEKTKAIYGARRIGKTIKKFEADFATIFKYSSRVLEGKTRYEFTGLTARGEAVVDSLRGGLVGFKGSFSKSPNESTGRGEFSENGSINAPNPPHARAPAQSVPFACKEKGNGEIAEPDDISDDMEFDL